MFWALLLLLSFLVISMIKDPTRVWSFDYQGKHIEVKNYAFSERIYINGIRIKDTRKKGFLLSSAVHEFEIAHNTTAVVQIEAVGFHVRCTVQVGNKIVYYSEDPKIIDTTHKDLENIDEQFLVAQELLLQICNSENESLIEASRLLWITLEETYKQSGKIQKAIESYKVLGETNHETSTKLLEKEEKRKQNILQMIKELHLITIQESGKLIDIPEQVENILNQIQIDREIEDCLDKTDKKIFLQRLRNPSNS